AHPRPTLSPYTTLFRSNVNRRTDPGDEFDQPGGRVQIGGQIQKHQVGPELPQADIERLHGRVTLHLSQNVERARLRQRGSELLRSEEHTSELQSPDHLV